MKKLLIIIFTITSIVPNVYSQNVDKNGGSIYSIFGVGELNYTTNIRNEGMGIMGIGLYGDYTNSLNPAAWTRINTTLFSSSFFASQVKSTDGVNKTNRNGANFESFNLSIPLNKGNGWILDIGFKNYSSVNYDIQTTGSSLGENYTQYYNGNGGLSRFTAGLSYIIFKHFSFGAQFNYMFGTIEKKFQVDFENTALFDTRNITTNTLHGIYFNTGLIFHGFDKSFKNKKLSKMTLGAYFSSPVKLTSEISGRFLTVSQIDSVEITSGKVEIPYAFGVGFSNEFNDKIIAAADFSMQNWDKYKNYGVHPTEIKNNMRFGLGLEYTPSKKLSDGFFSRTSYRIGGSYTQDYLKINGENINTIGITAGLSLPLSYQNKLDLAFGYQMRGKTTNGLVKDNVYKLSAAITIGELWFLKRPEDY